MKMLFRVSFMQLLLLCVLLSLAGAQLQQDRYKLLKQGPGNPATVKAYGRGQCRRHMMTTHILMCVTM